MSPRPPVMETATVEDYLKAIYRIALRADRPRASTGELAKVLDVSPASVTGMLHRLTAARLVEYVPRQGARLTARGRQLALRVVRRHRLLELFLAKSLGMGWDEVHAEAESLEHSASDQLIDRIDQHLGYPHRDPHGDPIPDGDGQLRAQDGEPLVAVEAGQDVELLRVVDASAELLRYLADRDCLPGTLARVEANDDVSGIIELRFGNAPALSFSYGIAARIRVRRRRGRKQR